jgi:hypothetical protein
LPPGRVVLAQDGDAGVMVGRGVQRRSRSVARFAALRQPRLPRARRGCRPRPVRRPCRSTSRRASQVSVLWFCSIRSTRAVAVPRGDAPGQRSATGRPTNHRSRSILGSANAGRTLRVESSACIVRRHVVSRGRLSSGRAGAR